MYAAYLEIVTKEYYVFHTTSMERMVRRINLMHPHELVGIWATREEVWGWLFDSRDDVYIVDLDKSGAGEGDGRKYTG